MSAEGVLNKESTVRMDRAISAYSNKLAPYIITCGWAYREDSDITIADAMKTHAINVHGISPAAIITETNSRDTVGDAVFTKRNVALKRGWYKFLVVTSDYHSRRTLDIFTFVYGSRYYIKVIGIPTDKKKEQSRAEQNSYHAFQNTFRNVEAGSDKNIYNILCQKHPFYNGKIYPKF